MIAETRAAPVLERPDGQLAHLAEPWRRQEYVVDMVGGTALLAVPPLNGRHRLLALAFPAQSMVGAGESEFLQRRDRVDVIDAPTGPMPEDIVVEVAGDDGRPLGEERLVFRECAPQRAKLV